MTSKRDRTTVRYHAAQYVARLCSGEMSREDQSRIRAWKRCDARHAKEFDMALQNWDSAGLLADDDDMLALCDGQRHPSIVASATEYVAEFWPRMALAATVLVAVVIGFNRAFIDPVGAPVVELISYQTRVGEQKKVELSDGSVIELNTDSRLLLDYTEKQRRVILDRGEAFFEVAKDSVRPFSVEIGARAVTALGTQFNVMKNREQLTVAVTEGVVALHPKDQLHSPTAPNLSPFTQLENHSDQYILAAGAVATLADSGPDLDGLPDWTVSAIEDPNLIATWRKGFVSFEGQSLYQVVQQINRYTQRKIQIEDVSLMQLKVNAVLHLNRVDSILAAFEASLPVKAKRYPDAIILAKQEK